MKKLKDYIPGENLNIFNDILDKSVLIDKLQNALAEEFNQWYMYTLVRFFFSGENSNKLFKLYDIQAKDELEDHAYWIAKRIFELGGIPDKVLSPDMWNITAKHKYILPDTTFNLSLNIEQNIQAERGAIETYKDLVAFTEGKDNVTNKKMKAILKDEEEHLQKLLDFQADINK